MTRALLGRMIALGVVVALGTFYIVVEVLGIHPGAQPFRVTVIAPSAGGVYPGAVVSYRGVPVGKVDRLDLRTDSVHIEVALRPGIHVAADSAVHIKELSALGEQYLDLVPPGPGGPDLHAGSTIPASQVTVPIPISAALLDLGSLLRSVGPGDVARVETFLYQAFDRTGPDLRTIVVTGQDLFHALVAAQAGTVSLIQDGQPVLDTFQQTDTQFTTFAAGLRSISGELARDNSSLQALIANGTAAASGLDAFLAANGTSLSQTISSLGTLSGIAQTYQPSVQQFFQVFPVVTGQLASTATSGQITGQLDINTVHTVCPYVDGAQIPLPTQPVASATLTNGCHTSAPDLLQRGAGSVPLPGT